MKTFNSLAAPAFGRRGQIEVDVLLLGEANEFPVVGQDAAVAIAEVLQHDFPRFAEAGRHFEQFDEILLSTLALR